MSTTDKRADITAANNALRPSESTYGNQSAGLSAPVTQPDVPPSPPAADDAKLFTAITAWAAEDAGATINREMTPSKVWLLVERIRTRLLTAAERGNLCDDGAPHIIRQVVTGQTTSGVTGLPVREMICTKCLKRQRDIENGEKT